MQFWGLLIILLSLVHFYRFGQANQSDDPKVRTKAGIWIFAGVMTILAGANMMRMH